MLGMPVHGAFECTAHTQCCMHEQSPTIVQPCVHAVGAVDLSGSLVTEMLAVLPPIEALPKDAAALDALLRGERAQSNRTCCPVMRMHCLCATWCAVAAGGLAAIGAWAIVWV